MQTLDHLVRNPQHRKGFQFGFQTHFNHLKIEVLSKSPTMSLAAFESLATTEVHHWDHDVKTDLIKGFNDRTIKQFVRQRHRGLHQ